MVTIPRSEPKTLELRLRPLSLPPQRKMSAAARRRIAGSRTEEMGGDEEGQQGVVLLPLAMRAAGESTLSRRIQSASVAARQDALK